MEVLKYTDIIEKTAIFPNTTLDFGISYCLHGINGELNEYFDAVKQNDFQLAEKELGDICWYITALSTELKLDIEEILYVNNILLQTNDDAFALIAKTSLYIGQISERVKKFYRDNKLFTFNDKNEIQNTLQTIVDILVKSYNMHFINYTSTNLPKILQLNYDKLTKRVFTNTLHGDGNYRED